MQMNFISGFEFGSDKMPAYTRDGDAAIDLRTPEGFILRPGEEIVVNTGLRFDMQGVVPQQLKELGIDIAAMVMPRSGLGFKFYTRLANTVGLIDSNYQGEIMVKIRNEHKEDDTFGTNTLVMGKGERFAQMMFVPVFNKIKFNRVDSFETTTNRGDNGFGSSGNA